MKRTLSLQKDAKILQDVVSLSGGNQEMSTTRSCDQFVIVSEKREWLPKDLSHIESTKHGVDLLENPWDPVKKEPIGSLQTMKGSFAIDKDAEQLAVEFYLPSAYRFVATVSSDLV